MIIPYAQARELIQEADVLLFHGGKFPSIGWVISTYTSGLHSHAAIASWDGDSLDCVEVREFKGGRSVRLSSQVKLHPGKIDVFRAMPKVFYEKFDNNEIIDYNKVLGEKRRHSITQTMRDLTGQSYGWSLIWQIIKSYLPFIRLAHGNYKDDSENNTFICSSSVAYSYRLNYMDPCPYLSDDSTKPADLARSPLFHYQFTIGDV